MDQQVVNIGEPSHIGQANKSDCTGEGNKIVKRETDQSIVELFFKRTS